MSLSYTKSHNKVAYDKDCNEYIYFHNEKGNEIINGNFEPIFPSGDNVIYITARRNAGKSTMVNYFIKDYLKNNKKNNVYLISKLINDDSIQDLKRLIRIPMNDLLEEINTIGLDYFRDSIVCFDDISDSKISNDLQIKFNKFIVEMIENSRHYNINIILTSHIACDNYKTRNILNEMNSLVIFPKYSNFASNERLLKNYIGFSKNQIEDIKNIKNSRWVFLRTIGIKYILTEKQIKLYD